MRDAETGLNTNPHITEFQSRLQWIKLFHGKFTPKDTTPNTSHYIQSEIAEARRVGGEQAIKIALSLCEAGWVNPDDDIKLSRSKKLSHKKADEKFLRLVMKHFFICVDKDIADISKSDLFDFGLDKVYSFYGGLENTLEAFKKIYSDNEIEEQSQKFSFKETKKPREKIYPWQMHRSPERYGEMQYRVWAMRWLAWSVYNEDKSSPRLPTMRDLERYHLRGLTKWGRISTLLLEADLLENPKTTQTWRVMDYVNFYRNRRIPYRYLIWEMSNVPNGFWEESKNRYDVTRWMIARIMIEGRIPTVGMAVDRLRAMKEPEVEALISKYNLVYMFETERKQNSSPERAIERLIRGAELITASAPPQTPADSDSSDSPPGH